MEISAPISNNSTLDKNLDEDPWLIVEITRKKVLFQENNNILLCTDMIFDTAVSNLNKALKKVYRRKEDCKKVEKLAKKMRGEEVKIENC